MSALSHRQLALHDGLWFAEHVLGGDRYRHWLGRVERRVRKRLEERLRARGDGVEHPIERRLGLDRRMFHRDYVVPGIPVVLAGAASQWPCVQRWTPDRLASQYGDDPVILVAAGTDDLTTGAQQLGGRTTTLGDQIRRMQQGHDDYARFSPLLHDHPELQDDFDLAWLRTMAGRLKGSEAFQLFMGGAGTDTALHAAAGANLFVQVVGRKRWWIASPKFSVALQPPRDGSPYFHSAVDATDPDLDTHPLFAHIDLWTCELSAGDVLYNPPFYWHQVRNETMSIGVGYRWYAPAPLVRASPIMLLLSVFATNPPLWVARRHRRDFAKIFGELVDFTQV